ncbi:MAG: glycine cleavage system aminomethyltransferase GcvT [Acidimicrobiales bacterium]
MGTEGDLRRSALYGSHLGSGAKLMAFGGWEMPLSYPSGTLAEHRACRSSAAVFDVSHLGTIALEGAEAFAGIQSTLTNDLSRISPGRAQYSHLLDDDGSVLDDMIVWWVSEERFDVMPNASNTETARRSLGGRDTTSERCVIAVQGPSARHVLSQVCEGAAAIGRFCVGTFEWRGGTLVAAGTGYTGEDGVECALDNGSAPELWAQLVACGATPAGLGARDTLRLEAGFPLHGHELGPGITPLQAGLSWVVSFDKGGFKGRQALEKEREHGVARRVRGLITDGRRPPRQGSVVRAHGKRIGTVTSGNFSPMLEVGIALALIDEAAQLRSGDALEIDGQGGPLAARVTSVPFWKSAG